MDLITLGKPEEWREIVPPRSIFLDNRFLSKCRLFFFARFQKKNKTDQTRVEVRDLREQP